MNKITKQAEFNSAWQFRKKLVRKEADDVMKEN